MDNSFVLFKSKRFQKEEARKSVEKVIALEIPAHVRCRIYWLNQEDITYFKCKYGLWLKNKHSTDKNIFSEKVLEFNGVDAYAHTDDFQWSSGKPVTVEFWSKVNEGDERHSVAFTVGNQNPPNCFQAHAPWHDKHLYWDYGDVSEDSGGGRVSTDYESHLNRWFHVALVSQGNSGNVKAIYLNGKKVSSNQTSDGPDSDLTGFWLGKRDNAYHKGAMTEFRIWNRVRSKEEICANRYKRLRGDEDNLVGYWPMNEGSGNRLKDLTSNAKHADIHNATWTNADDLPCLQPKDIADFPLFELLK